MARVKNSRASPSPSPPDSPKDSKASKESKAKGKKKQKEKDTVEKPSSTKETLPLPEKKAKKLVSQIEVVQRPSPSKVLPVIFLASFSGRVGLFCVIPSSASPLALSNAISISSRAVTPMRRITRTFVVKHTTQQPSRPTLDGQLARIQVSNHS